MTDIPPHARIAFVALALALAATGCPFTVTQLNRLPPTQPLAAPVSIDGPGPLRHEASGVEFAERYDGFERVAAVRYDTAGLDVSVGYDDRRPDCLIVATVYLYPTPRMSFVGASRDVVAAMESDWLAREYARSKADVQTHHPAMVVIAEEPASTPSGLAGRSLRFRDGRDVSEMRLFVFAHQWFLKYRITHPETCTSDATERIDALLRRLG